MILPSRGTRRPESWTYDRTRGREAENFEMLHGRCVALGTVAAAYISKERGLIDSEALSVIERGNRMFGLPCRFEGLALKKS